LALAAFRLASAVWMAASISLSSFCSFELKVFLALTTAVGAAADAGVVLPLFFYLAISLSLKASHWAKSAKKSALPLPSSAKICLLTRSKR
jgi:hypothetical protein